MSWLACLYRQITGREEEGSSEVTSQLRGLRKVADMHFAESTNSYRVFLDNIEMQNRSEKTISEMVDFMSRERNETGRS